MVHKMLQILAGVLSLALIACHCPHAWASSPVREPVQSSSQERVRASDAEHPPRVQPRTDSSKLSDEQRAKLADREKQNGDIENYEGGVTIVVGAGVLVVALLVVLVIVAVD